MNSYETENVKNRIENHRYRTIDRLKQRIQKSLENSNEKDITVKYTYETNSYYDDNELGIYINGHYTFSVFYIKDNQDNIFITETNL